MHLWCVLEQITIISHSAVTHSQNTDLYPGYLAEKNVEK